jgi:hypothetical protein
MVERAPMIASLLRQMGLKIETALNPDSRLILDADQHTFNVFHVEHAQGNPSIPAQADFVTTYGIRSALGFGAYCPGVSCSSSSCFRGSRFREKPQTCSAPLPWA